MSGCASPHGRDGTTIVDTSILLAWWRLVRTATLVIGALLSVVAVVEVMRVYVVLRAFSPWLGLGFLLFVRGHGNAVPTREGEAFAHEVERTYAGLDHLHHAARQIRELGTGPLRVAYACRSASVTRKAGVLVSQRTSA